MAYCEDYYWYQEDDNDGFNLYPQEDGTFQFAQTLPSMASFGHENSIYTLFQYDPPACYRAYDSATTFSAARCSSSNFSQPLLIQYDPNLYDSDFIPNTTEFVVSYSVSEFGDPEFEEFNPTPYVGGYDLAQTYGSPLPASDEICHPRSQAGPVSDQVGNGFAALPREKEKSFEQEVKPPNKGENQKGQMDEKEEREKTNDGGENRGKKQAVNEDENVEVPQVNQNPTGYGQAAIVEEEKSDEDTNDGGENGGNRETVYEFEIAEVPQVSQVPSGYGLEATDLCESLFGYWPCLSKMNEKRDERGNGSRETHGNQWSIAADYLFGSSDPYAEMTNEGRSPANPICSHERFYQLQSYYGYADDNC